MCITCEISVNFWLILVPFFKLSYNEVDKYVWDGGWRWLTTEIDSLWQNFLDLINSFKKEHLEYLHNNLFNIYLEECGLFTALSKIIITGDKKREREFIDIAIKEYKSYPLGIFDPADFIHRVIIFHLQNNLKDISFLLTLAEIPRSKKDQALLKTLLIDYI